MNRSAPAAVAISRGGGEQLDEVLEIMTAAFDHRFGEAWTRAQCAGILPMAGVTLTIARHRFDAVGFSLARQTMDEAELLLLAVRPEVAGAGIGSSLLERFVAEQQETGVHHLHLEVRDGNPAVHLYERQGFTVAGRRSNYYHGPDGQSFDALTMVRTL